MAARGFIGPEDDNGIGQMCGCETASTSRVEVAGDSRQADASPAVVSVSESFWTINQPCEAA